jgi:hypothetical protein
LSNLGGGPAGQGHRRGTEPALPDRSGHR